MKSVFKTRALTSTIFGGVLATAGAFPAFAADVTEQRLENADQEPQNWLLPHGNFEAHSSSRLKDITRDNVKSLKVAYTIPLGTALKNGGRIQIEYRPLVDNGFMYFDDGWGGIFKADLTSGDRGKIVWMADAALSKDESPRTRGMAFYGNNVYLALTDGRVVAVDRDTGEFTFDKPVARIDYPGGAANVKVESFTASPLVVDGKVLVGNAGGDALSRGWLEALDAKSGDIKWRTYTVPGPGEPGHESWKDKNNAWEVGGAALWTTGTYDKDQRQTYWGTGNAEPMYDAEYRPGDNLYSVSVVAFNVDDGKIKWYFQYTPNENWDYDENGVHMIVRADGKGIDRKMLAHFGRNGFLYRLDATNGNFIDASQFVEKVNWTTGIDPKTGKPTEYDPNLDVQTYLPGARQMRNQGLKTFCPTQRGGVRWQPPAYNPDTHLVYAAGEDGCRTGEVKEVVRLPNSPLPDPKGPGGKGGQINAKFVDPHGLVTAADATTNKIVARYTHKYDNISGVLATAGGVVYTGTQDGNVLALDDKTLQELWHFNTGTSVKGAPMSFAVNGKQYIAVVVGGVPSSNDYADLLINPGAAIYVFSL